MSGPTLTADELGDLRALIRTLKEREAELRRTILERRPNGPLEGARFQVTVRNTQRFTFDASLLSDDILGDPRYCRAVFDAGKLPDHIRDDPRYLTQRFVANLLPDKLKTAPEFCTVKASTAVTARVKHPAHQNRK